MLSFRHDNADHTPFMHAWRTVGMDFSVRGGGAGRFFGWVKGGKVELKMSVVVNTNLHIRKEIGKMITMPIKAKKSTKTVKTVKAAKATKKVAKKAVAKKAPAKKAAASKKPAKKAGKGAKKSKPAPRAAGPEMCASPRACFCR